jgi:RNA polymerase sigma factor (sigma-70 family)
MELLERFAQGDMDAFEALFREFQGEVYAWTVRIVRSASTAEDLTVETFWRIYRAHARFEPRRRSRLRQLRERGAMDESSEHLQEPRTEAEAPVHSIHPWRGHPAIDPDGSFGAWARRIATNLALDHLKKVRRELPLLVDPVEETRANPGVQRERREQIERAFRELSPRLRAVATLALVEELPYEEIAEGLGISIATVRVRVFRAVRILRERLADLRTVPQLNSSEQSGQRAAEEQRNPG